QEPARPDAEQTGPIQEDPAQPETPLLFADNGVPARTLVPTSPEGYVVTGDVYINNRSDRELDASIFDGTFAAALSEEEGPQVLIVHTHGSEAYTMPAGQEYVPSSDSRTTDSRFNVVRVGEELKKTLEEAGLTVLHDETLHDYPEYSGAYNRSLSSVEEYLKEYPTIAYVLDIHRDAISDSEGSPYKVVSAVAGVNAAQMSLVIGTDGGGLEHPDWRENLKLAAVLQQRITDSFPTLMRPITVRNSRYNQHITPGCLLIEMGAAGNSLDEALLSARLLGEQLGALIVEKG
ncbi:MAG: stage II sporulation protein P, partial [Oscillospiraceae bacterium]|nr:stage II sporulation protein P [Oscillospiraceae bacterium]